MAAVEKWKDDGRLQMNDKDCNRRL
eukprot:COSAG06_NODE_18704_length_873_cov_1.353169_1_plen_24_part_01